ncbi:response regulator [Lachnospira multipara]|uniref:response regulator n=1 Tax=Lachnospira multipara TaxID=28051 RepID=UPI000480A89A|nr:response regulator [Lachnospira multipara]
MKKILFISKTNNDSKKLNDYLQKYFRIQLCLDNFSSVESMLTLVEPDFIICLLQDMTDDDIRKLGVIPKNYPRIPLMTVGSEEKIKSYEHICKNMQNYRFEREVDGELILRSICNILKIKVENVLKAGTDEKKEVLIVDDDAMTLRSIKKMLDDYYSVSIANSGMKAMTSIGKKRPDLILLDYEMPVCDGKQTLEMIKADDDIKDIPVVFLTGVNDREHIEAVLKLLPSGYLLKPVSQTKLVSTIKNIIG